MSISLETTDEFSTRAFSKYNPLLFPNNELLSEDDCFKAGWLLLSSNWLSDTAFN